jgi:dihydroneopterin aldolase
MSVLEFRAARLSIRLGCSDEERAHPQDVDLDLAIRFPAPPSACETDELKDTVCYAELLDAARTHCQGREFRLLEKLASELLARLRREVPPGAELWLRVTKLYPPVPELRGGVSFSLGDWEPGPR